MTWHYIDTNDTSLRHDEEYIERRVNAAHHAIERLLANVYAYHLRVQHLDRISSSTIAHLVVTEPAFLKVMALSIERDVAELAGHLYAQGDSRSLTYLDSLLYGKDDDPLPPKSDTHVRRTAALRRALGQFQLERMQALELLEEDPDYIFSDEKPLAWPVQTLDFTEICTVVVNTFDKLVGYEAEHVIELGDETISLTDLLRISRKKALR